MFNAVLMSECFTFLSLCVTWSAKEWAEDDTGVIVISPSEYHISFPPRDNLLCLSSMKKLNYLSVLSSGPSISPPTPAISNLSK